MSENEITIIKQDKNFGKFLNPDTNEPINFDAFPKNQTIKAKYIYHDKDKGSYYLGDCKNGMFHGTGTIHFKNGISFTGNWTNGKCEEDKMEIKFEDGLEYNLNEDDWDYCNPNHENNDRRFYLERCAGLKPAGRENTIDTDPKLDGLAHPIPHNSYDTGDGYYIEDRRIIYNYAGQVLRFADEDEHYWIIKNCRKGWDDFVGTTDTWRMNNVQERKDYCAGKLSDKVAS